MKIAISGASGKTGYRIAEEAVASGLQVRLLIRKDSVLPESLLGSEKYVISLNNKESLDQALNGCDSLIIATGARPSIDLTGPARVDACGVTNQVQSCLRVGIKRVILVSSLCAGKWIHPLNLFGLILIWKRLGEKALQNSSVEWTIIRPGGLNENEEGIDNQAVYYSGPDEQKDAYIPRRLVAKSCIEALNTSNSVNRIIEVTANTDIKPMSMNDALMALK